MSASHFCPPANVGVSVTACNRWVSGYKDHSGVGRGRGYSPGVQAYDNFRSTATITFTDLYVLAETKLTKVPNATSRPEMLSPG